MALGEFHVDHEEVGEKEILVTKGNLLGITFDEIFLPVKLNDLNPFEIDGHAVYENSSGDIYLGVPVET